MDDENLPTHPLPPGEYQLMQQKLFNAQARARLADPMVTDEPRTESTLDSGEDVPPNEWFDDAPGSFENDVLARLENIESAIADIHKLNTQTHSVMENIAKHVELIITEVEPTIKMLTESKLFRMFVPQKGGK